MNVLFINKNYSIAEKYCFIKYVQLAENDMKPYFHHFTYDFKPPKDDMWYVNDCQKECQKHKKCEWFSLDMGKTEGKPDTFVQPKCHLLELKPDSKKKMPYSKDGVFSLY